jgi:hypothetical protein
VIVGTPATEEISGLIERVKTLGIAVRNDRPQWRYSGLLASLRNDRRSALA